MKTKLFAFMVFTLISVCAFASREQVPSDAVLADYYNSGDVCVCMFVPENIDCQDIVLVGSFHTTEMGYWITSPVSDLLKFEAVFGYDGWYVASFTPEANPDAARGIQAKPVMLDVDGSFNWEYQVSAASAIRGGVQVVPGAFAGEVDLINYGTEAPNVFAVDAWKQNPSRCFHHYIVAIINNHSCEGNAVPFITGSFNSGQFQQMQLDVSKTQEYGADYYYCNVRATNSSTYQVVSGLKNANGEIIIEPGNNDDSYLQINTDSIWTSLVGTSGNGNFVFSDEKHIVFDIRDTTVYRWARCAEKMVVSVNCNTNYGSINGKSGTFHEGEAQTYHAIAKYGYHFTHWSDGITENPRTIIFTQDTTLTAEFVPNLYNINVTCDEAYGHIEGENGIFDYMTTHEYSAVANYGYHFDRWSDGKTQNPRAITVNEDISITALFAPNKYVIQDVGNSNHGYINGIGAYDYLSENIITAVNQYGYHFTQWSDGVADNPRTIVLTQDTTFIAEFAIDKSGICGKDSALNWSYEEKSKTLTITGNGALTENYTFGVEAPTQMQNLIIGNDVTEIGERAFYAKNTINHLTIGGNVASIGDYAFAECKNFDDITCYATVVPTINGTTFANVGNKQYIYLFVPEDRERAYKRDTWWGQFDIQIKGAEETTTDGNVTVLPTDNTVEITWPSVNNAETYEIVITKDGEVVCTLIFNANGQLTGIAFAPSRNNTQQAQTSGFRFTVTGLTSNTHYGYAITSKDAEETTIDTKSGSFTTTLDGQSTEGVENVLSIEKVTKFLHNGQILILRGDKTYTLTGQEIIVP